MIPKLKKANFTTTIALFLFSINNIGINKIVVSNMVSFGKKNFKYLIGYKDANKNRPFCIFLQKWVHIDEILMKLNIYIFFDKKLWILRKI